MFDFCLIKNDSIYCNYKRMDETEVLSVILALFCFIVIYQYITTREVHFLSIIRNIVVFGYRK